MKKIRDTTTSGSAKAMDHRKVFEAARRHSRATSTAPLMKAERIPPRESEKNRDTIRITAAKSASAPLPRRPRSSPKVSRSAAPEPAPVDADRADTDRRRLRSTSQKTRLKATGIAIST